MNINLTNKNASNQKGFGLIELMVSMVIALIALSAIGFVFVNAQDVFQTQKGAARIQENGRFAVEMMARDIRHAGYFGCIESNDFKRYQEERGGFATDSAIVRTLVQDDPLITNLFAVEGFQNKPTPSEAEKVWSPSGAPLPENMVTDSDGVTIRFANPDDSVGLSRKLLASYESPLPIDASTADVSAWQATTMVVVSNCDSVDVIELSDAPSVTTMNNTLGLSASYGDDTKIRSYEAIRYFIQNQTVNGSSVPTLMREELFISGGIQTSPLIDGIDSFQILFGSDNTGDGVINVYQNADEVVNWQNISSVQIAVLASSVNEYGQNDETDEYKILDETLTPGDAVLGTKRLQRNIFSTTVALRQR